MITIRPHNPHDYAVLPDIDDRQVQSLTRADSDCLDKLGNFLVMAHANDRFGASPVFNHPCLDVSCWPPESSPG
jgi:hypothetical protein